MQVITIWSIESESHILPIPTAITLNSRCSWADDVSQAPLTITVDLLLSMAE